MLLAHKSMSILSEKLTEGQEFGYQIGTGLFAVERWVPGDYVSFVRNEHFHGEKSPTRRIVFRLIKEESSRLIALQTGEIDVCVDPLATDLPYIENDKNLELVSIPNVVMLYIALNNEKPGLDNVHVRRAIAHATDKESMILVGYNGVGTVHNNFINRGQFGLYEDIRFTSTIWTKLRRIGQIRLQARRPFLYSNLQRYCQGKHGSDSAKRPCQNRH